MEALGPGGENGMVSGSKDNEGSYSIGASDPPKVTSPFSRFDQTLP
jgi:hypothetical protein